MTPEQLHTLRVQGESSTLEFKTQLFSTKETAVWLAAFANSTGGTLLIGIRDDGQVAGVDNPEPVLEHLESAANTSTPTISYTAGSVEVEGKQVVWCSVGQSTEPTPHAVEGSYPQRVGARNAMMDPQAIAAWGPLERPRLRVSIFDRVTTSADSLEKLLNDEFEVEEVVRLTSDQATPLYSNFSKRAEFCNSVFIDIFSVGVNEGIDFIETLHQMRPDVAVCLYSTGSNLSALPDVPSHWRQRLSAYHKVLKDASNLPYKVSRAVRALLTDVVLRAQKENARERRSGDPAEGAPAPVTGKGLHFVRDASDEEAALNVDIYSACLERIFTVANEDFSFGLFGPWGRGKTYLMDRVSSRLNKNAKYVSVRFSAWAYPQTPLLWAHLYQRLADKAMEGSFGERTGRILRARILRHEGLGRITTVVFLFGLGAVPFGLWYSLGKQFYIVFGLAGVLLLVRLARRGPGFVHSLRSILAMPQHSEHLGLQAVIGRDLQSLLVAWIRPSSPVKGGEGALFVLVTILVGAILWPWSETGCTYWLGVFLTGTWALTLAIAGCLVCRPSGAPKRALFDVVAVLAGAILWPWSETARTWVLLAGIWALTLAIAGRLVCRPSGEPKRALLVVDDLDRCEPMQMLEVVENIRLFLESNGVAERMQVAMLLDDAVLSRALVNKYADDSMPEEERNWLIEECVEKLFVVFLRLPSITEGDIQELVHRHFASLRALASTQDNASAAVAPLRPGPPEVKGGEASAEKGAVNGLPKSAKRSPGDASIMTFEAKDESALSDAAASLLQSRSGRVGPRNIRSLFFRYQLARMLLVEHNRKWDPAALADALADTMIEPVEFTLAASLTEIAWAARQVSLPPRSSIRA